MIKSGVDQVGRHRRTRRVRGNSPFSSIVKETSWWSSSAWIGREASKGSNSVVGLFGVGAKVVIPIH